ncbi:MAG: hypothetical protein JWM09_1029 [Francisellaceae bacterium]|nr:hypothetical protein [Francisellaceae bacterium]
MLINSLKKNYVSEEDIFLQNLDKSSDAFSPNRINEHEKHKAIGQLRDEKIDEEVLSSFFEEF